MPASPGPFGWVGNLFRWSAGDVRATGQGGPLPPPKARTTDPTEHDLYQGTVDGWMHGTVGAALSSFFSEPRTRKELYVLYEKMDMTDLGGSVLDLYADDATQPDPDRNATVWFEGSPEIVAECDALAERLKWEEDSPALARDIAKFGDDFERIVYRSGPDGGVMRMIPTPPLNIMRKEDKNGKLEGYTQNGKRFRNDNSDTSYPWDFVHFRYRSKDRRYPYGTSILHNGIRPWKQTIVLDDWLLGYTVSKQPDRNLFLLDQGSASDMEATDNANRFRQRLRKHVLMDPGGSSGKSFGFNVNPSTPMEDMVLPIRNGSSTTVQKLSGSANAADCAPSQMYMDRFFMACRTPKSFLGYDSSTPTNPKASLCNQDVKYARAVKRLQRSLKQGYRYLAELNLILKMSPGDRIEGDKQIAAMQALDWRLEGNDFKVCMASISFLEELERLEVMQTRQQVALVLMELSANNPTFNMLNWTSYILKEIVRIPEEKVDELLLSELQQHEILNMQLGARPDGSIPGQDKVAEMRNNRIPLALLNEARKADGNLREDEKKALSEAITNTPELRRMIHMMSRTMRETIDEPIITAPSMLPDRESELFKKGLLTDALTEADLEEIAASVMNGSTGKING